MAGFQKGKGKGKGKGTKIDVSLEGTVEDAPVGKQVWVCVRVDVCVECVRLSSSLFLDSRKSILRLFLDHFFLTSSLLSNHSFFIFFELRQPQVVFDTFFEQFFFKNFSIIKYFF